METIRKVVTSMTGDAGMEHAYPSQGGRTTAAEPQHEEEEQAATSTTSESSRAAGRQQPLVSEPQEEEGGRRVGTRTGGARSESYAGHEHEEEQYPSGGGGGWRGEEKAAAGPLIRSGRDEPTSTYSRTTSTETPLDTDKERQKREQEVRRRQAESERGVSREPQLSRERETAATSGREAERTRESKPFTETIKEKLGMGGPAEAAKSEELRAWGYEKGQVPYDDPHASELVRRRYQEEQAAIKSGHVWEGQRLKDPEFHRTTFQRIPEEEKLSEQRWNERRLAAQGGGGGGVGREEYGRRGEERRQGGRREEEGIFGRTLHEIERAVGIGGEGGVTSGAGAGMLGGLTGATRSITSVSAYPLCLRVLLKPRPDIRDSNLEGDIILVQNSPTGPTQVIGSCRGINPGVHGMAILENGDLSLGRSSAGLHFDAPHSTASHGGANTKERHLGDLGNIVVKDDGVAFFNFEVDNLPLLDVAGRSLAIMSGEDDLGTSYCQCAPGECRSKSEGAEHTRCGPHCRGATGGCFACISERTGNAGHTLGLGVIFRTDLRAMERLKNIKLGPGVGETTHREVKGRPMQVRPSVKQREEPSISEKMFGRGKEETTEREAYYPRETREAVHPREQQREGPYYRGGERREEQPSYGGVVGGGYPRERESYPHREKGGWQQFKESWKSAFGGGESEQREREERGMVGRRMQESRGGEGRRGVGGGYEEERGYGYGGGRSSYGGVGYEPKEESSYGRSRGEDYGFERRSFEQPERIRGRDIGSKMSYSERPLASGRSAHADY